MRANLTRTQPRDPLLQRDTRTCASPTRTHRCRGQRLPGRRARAPRDAALELGRAGGRAPVSHEHPDLPLFVTSFAMETEAAWEAVEVAA